MTPPRPAGVRQWDFISAVRTARARSRKASREASPTSGLRRVDDDPAHEAVKLLGSSHLAFPAHEVESFEATGTGFQIVTNVMGLIGPMGVLPEVYTARVQEAERNRTPALKAFLDMITHRSLTLFARAFDKYEPGRNIRAVEREERDVLAEHLLALVGMAPETLRGVQSEPDATFVHFAGRFAGRTMSPRALSVLLSHRFGDPIEVVSFHGRWIDVPEEHQTRLGEPSGNAVLGESTLLGSAAFDVQNSFLLRIGPLAYQSFRAWLPSASGRANPRPAQLGAIVRHAVGPTLDYEVQLRLQAGERPAPRLDRPDGMRLGWNCWLGDGSGPQVSDDARLSEAHLRAG